MSKQNYVTPEDIMEMISEVQYVRLGNKTTVCCVVLENGFEVVGTSFVIDPKDFNEAMGQEVALRKAVEEARRLEAYFITCLNSEADNCDCENEQEHDCDCEDMHGCDCGCEDEEQIPCTCDCSECEHIEQCQADAEEDEPDFRDCSCYGCEEPCEGSECNNGCPHVDCDQNEENDFQGYEDDGTEEYPEFQKKEEEVAPEQTKENEEHTTLKLKAELELVMLIHMINPTLTLDQAKAFAKSILG